MGYPASPDHTEKGTLFELLQATANAGIELTENYAMWPGSSVSGLYFAHPQAAYFAVGKLERDQVEDYAARKGMDMGTVERWLGPNLFYDPEPAAVASGNIAAVPGSRNGSSNGAAANGVSANGASANRADKLEREQNQEGSEDNAPLTKRS
jgi:hypothetical protein